MILLVSMKLMMLSKLVIKLGKVNLDLLKEEFMEELNII